MAHGADLEGNYRSLQFPDRPRALRRNRTTWEFQTFALPLPPSPDYARQSQCPHTSPPSAWPGSLFGPRLRPPQGLPIEPCRASLSPHSLWKSSRFYLEKGGAHMKSIAARPWGAVTIVPLSIAEVAASSPREMAMVGELPAAASRNRKRIWGARSGGKGLSVRAREIHAETDLRRLARWPHRRNPAGDQGNAET